MNSNGTAFHLQWPMLKQYLLQKMELKEVEPSSHAKSRMAERRIERADILDIVRFWSIDEMHEPYKYPYGEHAGENRDPVFSITGQDSVGRNLTTAFALKKHNRELWFEIVTVFAEDEHKRNRHQSRLDNNPL